jgi:hypothetical protein
MSLLLVEVWLLVPRSILKTVGFSRGGVVLCSSLHQSEHDALGVV